LGIIEKLVVKVLESSVLEQYGNNYRQLLVHFSECN